MVQIDPEPTYDHRLVEWVTLYLQTRDPRIFPFTRDFDEERRRAFVRDLRIALSDIQDSGSARKTAATGFIISDSALHRTVREWAMAGGDLPATANREDPTALVGEIS